MHACLLGVGKSIVNEWFDTKNFCERWYIRPQLKELNKRFLTIRQPCEITQVPKPVIENKYKAGEWKTFILYYSLPLLKDFLPTKYYQHWFLFVFSLNIWLKSQATSEELKLAKKSNYTIY